MCTSPLPTQAGSSRGQHRPCRRPLHLPRGKASFPATPAAAKRKTWDSRSRASKQLKSILQKSTRFRAEGLGQGEHQSSRVGEGQCCRKEGGSSLGGATARDPACHRAMEGFNLPILEERPRCEPSGSRTQTALCWGTAGCGTSDPGAGTGHRGAPRGQVLSTRGSGHPCSMSAAL